MRGGSDDVAHVAHVTWSEGTRAGFQARHVRALRPAVIHGLLHAWTAPSRWRWDWLEARFGDRVVRVSVDPDGVCSNRCMRSMPLRELLGRMDDGTLYLTELHLPTTLPELMVDVVEPELVPPGAAVPGRQPNAWICAAEVGKAFHYDTADGVLCQVVGRKRVWLVGPEQSDRMYPDRASAHPHNSRVRTPWAPDLEAFPAFAAVVPQVCELAPGDALYLPPGWWHCTRALTRSISVNYWWTE